MARSGEPQDKDFDIHGNHDRVAGVHERQADEETRLGNYHVDGLMNDEATTHANGYRLGRGFVGGGTDSKAEEKKKQTDAAFRRALKALQDQIDALNAQIAALERELSEIDEAMLAIRDGRELPENDAARRFEQEYRRRTGKAYDPSDPEAQALPLEIAQERRDIVLDQLDQLRQERDELEAKLDQGQKLGHRIAAAASPETARRLIEDSPLADAQLAAIDLEGEDKRRVDRAHGFSDDQSDLLRQMEDSSGGDDLSFMRGDASPAAPTPSAASGIDGATRINDGGNVQPTFARAVAGDAVPPGVEPPTHTGEQHAAVDRTISGQETAPA